MLQGFNEIYYLAAKLSSLQATDTGWQNKDTRFLKTFLEHNGFSPESHYSLYGYKEGLAPNSSFDASAYKLAKATALFNSGGYKSIADAKVAFEAAWQSDPYQHYLQYGIAEGLTATYPVQKTMPHTKVTIPSDVSLSWVNDEEINDYPYRAIGRISVGHSDGRFTGTGFLISPEHVLTNAHVILNAEGEFSSSDNITFYPGQNGTDDETVGYEGEYVWWEKTFTEDLYPSWPDNDLAIIKLKEPVANTGSFGWHWTGEDFLNDIDVKAAGYADEYISQDNPATRGLDHYQWQVAGIIDSYLFGDGALDLSDSMVSTGGASGSPIFYEEDGHYYFVGVYAGKYGNNPVAATLDSDSFNWLLGILQDDGYYLNSSFA